MKRNSRYIWVGALFCLVPLAASTASAMPAFSRLYQTSCVTCHEAFPKRNAVGEAFRMNGYRFPDNESYRKEEPVELGDEAYKRLWPRALWPSNLPGRIPLSLVSRFMLELDMDGSRDDTVMFLFPEEIEAVWAGTLGDRFTFYGDVIFFSKDFGGNDVESWATLKAWLQMEDVIGPENMVNIRVGTVGTQGMALFTARDGNNFTTHFYQYSTWMMPKPKLAAAGLNDFRGNPFSLQPQVGFEVNGVGKRWMYSLGVVSGNVKNPVNTLPDDDIYFVGVGEGNDSVDLFFQCAYKLGGMNMDGSDAGEESPLTARPEFWRDDNLTFSLFGYWGNADIDAETTAGDSWSDDENFWRLGIGAQQKYRDLTLNAGYMFGRNNDPYGKLSSDSVDSHAWFAEAYYFVFPWLIPYLRYEGLDLGLPNNVAGLSSDRDVQRFLVGAKALIRANVTLNVEGNFYSEGESYEEGIDNTLFMLLSAAF